MQHQHIRYLSDKDVAVGNVKDEDRQSFAANFYLNRPKNLFKFCRDDWWISVAIYLIVCGLIYLAV
jgi:hypothetical protein